MKVKEQSVKSVQFPCQPSLQFLFLPLAQSTGGCRMLGMLGTGEGRVGAKVLPAVPIRLLYHFR